MYLGHNMRPYMTYLPIKFVSPLTTRISVFSSIPLSLPGLFISQLQVNFSIKAIGVLDRQSLDDRFQRPIFFFSTITIVSLGIQSLFGP